MNSEINSNNANSFKTSEDSLMEENGFVAKINGEVFNPEEISLINGDFMTREITQLIQVLFQLYPLEAIDYCLKRCFYSSFSKTSLLDKTIKYLIDKYKKYGEECDKLIQELFIAYKDNILFTQLKNINQIEPTENIERKRYTKIVYYDQSKGDVSFKNKQNEIFIEINKADINEEIIPLEESEEVEIFLCEKHHFYKRFCRRKEFIYVYDFYNYKKIEKINKKRKKNNNKEEQKDNYEAIFHCELKDCGGEYKYNFNTNNFSEIKPHSDIPHDEKENPPIYYLDNIKILIEKPHITDIQMIICDN